MPFGGFFKIKVVDWKKFYEKNRLISKSPPTKKHIPFAADKKTDRRCGIKFWVDKKRAAGDKFGAIKNADME